MSCSKICYKILKIVIYACEGYDMYCRFCGTKNTDGHQYCKKCGKPLSISEEPVHPDSSSSAEQQTTSQDQDCPNSGVVCPNCHAGAEYCYPIAKTDIKSSGGYSFWNGCCGRFCWGLRAFYAAPVDRQGQKSEARPGGCVKTVERSLCPHNPRWGRPILP